MDIDIYRLRLYFLYGMVLEEHRTIFYTPRLNAVLSPNRWVIRVEEKSETTTMRRIERVNYADTPVWQN